MISSARGGGGGGGCIFLVLGQDVLEHCLFFIFYFHLKPFFIAILSRFEPSFIISYSNVC